MDKFFKLLLWALLVYLAWLLLVWLLATLALPAVIGTILKVAFIAYVVWQVFKMLEANPPSF